MKKRRVIITKLPQAKSGVEVKLDGLRAGLGFNANVMPWPIMAGKMSEPATDVNKTLKPVPRNLANLEAEKDEIAMIPDKGGIPSTFVIGGKRHHSGGTPLFLPTDSFIFSDTAKMRIKDPVILAQFGMPYRKSGYTPAEIAKKYDINKYKKILADPDTDRLQRETAELMIANNNLKLAKLAIYQESMKGFPQGMPQVGMPYLEEMEIDPAQFVQENPGQGEDETEEADNMSRFGGPYLPKAQWGKNTQSKMLPKFGEYSPNAGAADAYASAEPVKSTEGVSGKEGVEGVEGKPLTGKYQDWEMIKKKKAGISGIAKAEGFLTGLRGAQAFGNAREMLNLEQQMQEGSLYDNAVTPVQANEIGRQGSGVVSGMATGTQKPYTTGNLVQQPGMNYAIEGMAKYGGDIDYFAPGGYVPMAQVGYNVPDTLTRPSGPFVDYYTGGDENYARVMYKGKKYYRDNDIIISEDTNKPVTDSILKREILAEISRVNPNKWDMAEIYKGGNNQGPYKYTRGLYAPALPGMEKKDYDFLKKHEEPIKLYATALNSNNPEIMQKTADELNKKNNMQDLAGILRERAAKVKSTTAKSATNTSNSYRVPPGFKSLTDTSRDAYEFQKANPVYYKQFQEAFKLPNTPEGIAAKKRLADFFDTRDIPGSVGFLPWTQQDKLQDMAGILRNDPNYFVGQSLTPEVQKSFQEQNVSSDNKNGLWAQKMLAKALKKRDEAIKKDPTSAEALAYSNAVDELYELQPSWVAERPEEGPVRDPDSGSLLSPGKMYGAKRLNKLVEINKVFSPKSAELNMADASTERDKITAGVPATTSATQTTTVTTPTVNTSDMNQQGVEMIDGKTTGTAKKQSSSPKKYSNVEETDEDFKEGGSTGKRRVLIHSLGEYRMGGALKTYQDGGKTTEAKGKGIWQHSTKSGNWRLKYSDGTYGPVQKETPVLVTPYTGADAPSKYTEEQWQEFAKETGFTPQSADPAEQNREFQTHLSKHKDWGPKVAELHTKYGMPKGGKFDALLGKRWDAILDQKPVAKKDIANTPGLKADDKKYTYYTDPGVYAENLKQPNIQGPAPRFTLQDTLKGANLMADYLGVKRSPVWSATPAFTTPNVEYLSPEGQYQKINQQFNIAAQNLAQFGDPRQYNARLGQLQGQALSAIADTAARTEGENVRIGNAQAAQNAAMFNAFNQGEAARRTKDYESNITADDVFRNERKFARTAGINQLANAFTNRANIYNINQLYPQYAVDPTGMFYFKNPRDIKPDFSKQKTVVDYYNQILQENEHLRNQPALALKMAESMSGVKSTSDPYAEWLKTQQQGVIPSYANNVNPTGGTS